MTMRLLPHVCPLLLLAVTGCADALPPPTGLSAVHAREASEGGPSPAGRPGPDGESDGPRRGVAGHARKHETKPHTVVMPVLGSRMMRGPDWKWGEQDGGGNGTIVGTGGKPQWVQVHWDGGQENDYRYGAAGKFDVEVIDGFLPQLCNRAEDYGSVEAGAEVFLGKHRSVGGDESWSPEMDRFAGHVAKVTRFSGIDSTGCAVIRVDLDNGQFAWRVRDLGLP